MAQFDVYANPSKATKYAYPYLVDIQNPYISQLTSRIVIPLAKSSGFGRSQLEYLTPEIDYQGEKLLLLTPKISSMPAKILQHPLGSIAHLRSLIIAALDFAVSGD